MRAMRTGRPTVAMVLFLSASVLASGRSGIHYKIVAAGSDLRWDLPATLHTVHGVAPVLTGTLDAEPGTGGQWRIRSRVVVPAAAMTTGRESRDKKMREEVLETDKFPEVVFESRHVSADLSRFPKDEHFTVEVTGDLTVHGKAVRVKLPVDVFVRPDHVVLQGSFPLAWKQFGLADPSFGLIKVREPLKVRFRLRAVPI
jgi:polyisoprenoid-binding protein YceI